MAVVGAAFLAIGMTVVTEPVSAAGSQTYYVDADGGSDTADGLSPTTAWKSLAKANAAALIPGDTLAFQGGDTWHGGLVVSRSGTSGSPITVTSYGTGRATIAGDTLVDAAVALDNVKYVTVDGLEVTNGTDLTVAKSTTYRGIYAIAKDIGEVPGIIIRNNYVHNVDGKGGPVIGKGGIAVGVRGNTTPTWYSNLVIQGNEVGSINAYGISTFTTWCASCEIYPAETGIPSTEVSPTRKAFTGSQFLANYVHDVTAGGITPQYVDDGLVQDNRVDAAGAHLLGDYGNNAGIWWQGTNRMMVQYNVVTRQGYDHFRGTEPVDGMAFDADMGSTDSTVQYNYSDGNAGGFFMCLISASNPTVRYNVSHNDHFRSFSLWSGCWNLRAHNNTIWNTTQTITRVNANGSTYQQGQEAIVRSEQANGSFLLYNNLFYNPSGAPYRFGSDPRVSYSHNLYAGSTAVAANDEFPVTGSPALVNPDPAVPAGLVSRAALVQLLASFAPTATSAARNAGVSVSDARTDGTGTVIPAGRADIGAVQHAVSATATTTLGTSAGALANVVDNDASTSWATANSPTLPGSVTASYGEDRTFDAVNIAAAFGQGQGPTTVSIETQSGGTWTSRVVGAPLTWSSNSGTVEWNRVELPATVTASAVRVTISASNLTWGHAAIYEVRPTYLQVASANTDADYSNLPAERSVDRVDSQAWCSGSATVGRGIQIDPGVPQTVRSVRIGTAFGQGQGPTSVSVSVRRTDGSWAQVLAPVAVSWASNTSTVEYRTLTLPAAATGTTFSIVVNAANNSWGHYCIYEAQLSS
jgi:hypothetical protein